MRWALALLLVGCLPPGTTAPRPGQREAMAIVWVDTYQRSDPPPTIVWVEEAQQNCIDPASGKRGFAWLGSCHEGLTLTPFESRVSWHADDVFSSTAFAHESYHVVDARRGVFDFMHTGPAWGPAGEVAQANEALRADAQ